MALTGLALTGFVFVHMLGNLQIFLGQEQLNVYGEHLRSLPMLLWPARVFLFLTVVLHITIAMQLAIENKNARPVGYACEGTVQASLASRTMVISGLAIFAFIVFHLLHFTFGRVHPEFYALQDPRGRRDVYTMVILGFRDPWVCGSYVAAMALLWFHLSHGVASFFQTLGLNNEKTKIKFKIFAHVLAFIIFMGNSSIALAAFFKLLPLPKGGI